MTFDPKLAFRGIRAVYGDTAFEKFQHSHVTVIGVGGIGSWATEALCRSAVGRLTLIDADTIEISNSNRQLHTTTSTAGSYKVDVMKRRLLDINPLLTIDTKKVLLTKDNIETELEGLTDNVCECIDDLDAKAFLGNYLFKKSANFIVAGGAGGRTDPKMLALGDMSDACGDALISKVRSTLRKEYGFPKNGKKMNIVCTYSKEKPIYSSKEGYISGDLPAFGASMAVTASAGLLIASWMLKQLAK